MIGRKCKYKSISLLLAALLLLTSCGSETENAAQSQPEQAQPAVTEQDAGSEQGTEPEPEQEPKLEPEPELEPDQEPWPWSTYDSSDEPKEPSAVPAAKATRLRIHIVDNGSDAINITVPLAAASLLSGLSNMVAGYTEGINLDGLVELVKDAEPGMLIDIDDGLDSVHISLE